ncbi:S8 family serine peptidase [Candidatus Laterigemmans baculatus]|uniref:S8 family serine peptidase n=1 Tax=Candidatus Laterigemmans baculatus TaxID=2770505 RepID=UPI0013D928B8|nr:S8 family serine peptidase [Candidatus Laterigemmans baculatus]
MRVSQRAVRSRLRFRHNRSRLALWLGFERLEDRRLLAVVSGLDGSEPWPTVEAPATAAEETPAVVVGPVEETRPFDIVESDLAHIGPYDSPVPISEDSFADMQLATSNLLLNLDVLRNDPRFAGITGDGTGSGTPIGVAVVDSGIDIDHPYLNFAGGHDLYHLDPNPNDFTGHGTHVAGIIGSTHGTYTGVAPGVNLYGVKVFSDTGGPTPFTVIERGLQWVIDNAEANNIQVVNISIGNGGNHQTGTTGRIDDEIAQLESMGITVVSASGNNYAHVDPTPGQAYPGVNSTIGVGAVWAANTGRSWNWASGAIDYSTDVDRIVSFSQRDASNPNQLMAPGASIVSTLPTGGFGISSGTSMASPHVAGLVALLQDAALEFGGELLDPHHVVDIIRSTATVIHDGDDEHDNVLNTALDYLRIDAYAAVEAVFEMFGDSEDGDFPTPLQAVSPLGSLIYDSAVEGRIQTPLDQDTFTIGINAGQTISLIAEAGGGLRPQLEIYDPNGDKIASVAASASGGDALLQTVPAGLSGTYQIVVSDAAGSSGGNYRVGLVLGAALESEGRGGPIDPSSGDHTASNNDAAATAENLESSFIPIARGADRGAVRGSLNAPAVVPGGLGRLYAFDYASRQILEIDRATGAQLNQFSSPLLESIGIDFGMATTPTSLLIGGRGTQPILEMDPDTGEVLRVIPTPSIEISGLAFLNEEIFILSDLTRQITVLDYATGAVTRSFSSPAIEGLAASETELYGTYSNQLFRLDAIIGSPTFLGVLPNSSFVEGLGIIGDELYASNRFPDQILIYDLPTLTLQQSMPMPSHMSIEALGADGAEAPPPAVLDDADTYAFQLQAGQQATLVVETMSSAANPLDNSVRIEVVDAAGTVLASGGSSLSSGRSVIENFAAPNDGTYHARVARATASTGAVDYSLVVTRGATFELDTAGPLVFSDLITNGSFETGDFAGWTTQHTGPFYRPWQVTTGGAGGFGAQIDRTAPQEGNFAAWNGFDGYGPMQFRMFQDVHIPASAETATLEWMHRLQWQFNTSATQPRTLQVQVQDPLNGEVLATPFSFSTGLLSGDSGWTTQAVDLSDFAGQRVRIAFLETIPEPQTGPGQAEFDRIELTIGERAGSRTRTFDFEEFLQPPRGIPSLSTIQAGIESTIRHEHGALFNVDRRFGPPEYTSHFDRNSFSAFTLEPGRFLMDFSEPMSQVSIDMGDFGQDQDDLQLIAYSGPGGTGQALGSATGILPGANNSFFVAETLSVTAPGIRSVAFIGGSTIHPNSVFYDNVHVVTTEGQPTEFQNLDPTGLVLGHVAEDAPDVFAFTVGEGEQFSLSTLTPGSGPLEFGNPLNPRLELLDPDGNLLAIDSQSEPDQRNARLVYTAQTAGTYRVRVAATAGTQGEYVLRLNRSPKLNADALTLQSVAIDEHGIARLNGSYTDSDAAENHTVTVTWGDGTTSQADVDPQTQAFTASHQYLDDGTPSDQTPSAVYAISVTVTDAERLTDTAETELTVHNLPPQITRFESSATFDARAAEGETVSVEAAFTDAGTLDTHSASILWGDGTPAEPVAVSQLSGAGSLSASHNYDQGGVYTVTLTLIDDDSGAATTTTTSVIIGASVSADGVLRIVGTDADDRVHLNMAGPHGVRVHSDFFAEAPFRDFAADPIVAIQMWLGDGDDRATIAGNITLPVSILGERGNDTLDGAKGPAVLIGGLGEDRLTAASADSLLIGGRTAYDSSDAAILALLTEWTRNDLSYSERVTRLRTGLPHPTGATPLRLLTDETVFDDETADQLTGAGGEDWFFHSLGQDRIRKLQPSEQTN